MIFSVCYEDNILRSFAFYDLFGLAFIFTRMVYCFIIYFVDTAHEMEPLHRIRIAVPTESAILATWL